MAPIHTATDRNGSSNGSGNAATRRRASLNETTPLLAAGDFAPTADPEIAEATTNNTHDYDSEDEDGASADKPLPVGQILALCYARWVEPVAFFCIFPYINKMAQENGHLADTDVGFYSGLIESLFSLTQMTVMIMWGRAADRFGRKPVLVLSLVGVTCATSMFGMATTIWQMVLFRCLAGVFGGVIVTIRTMISEHSTSKTQARAFSWFAFSGNMGILFGPLIGGALADPAGQYPGLFGGVRFFEAYPYALPSFAVGTIGVSAVVVTALFVDETLVRKDVSSVVASDATITTATATGGEEETTTGLLHRLPLLSSKLPSLSTWDLLKSPGVSLVLYVYGHVMLLAQSYTAIVTVVWFTRVDLGGFGFSPLQISILMGLNGLAQAIWILLVFPPLQHRIGTNGVIRACGVAYPFFFLICPLLNMLLRGGTPGLVTAFWVLAPTLLCIGCGVSMSFTAVQLALNEVSPSPAVLGTLNAVALSITSGMRAFSPALFTSLFAVGARTQALWGYAIWVVMVAIAVGFAVVSRYMPDYAELKKQRRAVRAGQGAD